MRPLIYLLLCFFNSFYSVAQSQYEDDRVQVLFWNVENLFDIEDDSLTNDDEFVPYSMRGWNYERYEQKLFSIYKTIVAIGGWQVPDIVALAEVENRKVLEDLLEKTPLFRAGYDIIHQDSEDRRGIDLAVLYRPSALTVVDTSFLNIRFPQRPQSRTRDILHLKFKMEAKISFDLFVNHWPSRYGGGRSSEDKRLYVAEILKTALNNIYTQDSLVNCVILGDFNDLPEDASLHKLATAKPKLNLLTEDSFQGTHKHQGVWSHFDQIWVSESLMHEGKWVVTSSSIFHPEWMLKNDKTFGGLKPRRTYEGYRYQGGFSDHLPVYLELGKNLQLANKRTN
jgi:predicted extracellular nuclease